jgi:hypothetical protein
MNYGSILSDEEAVKSWLRDYSGELLSVGIKLGLSPTQQVTLQNRLFAIRHGFDAMAAIKANFLSERAPPLSENDPIRLRWLEENLSKQVGQWEAA